MIEERIIEWLDLGDSVQRIDIYQKKKLLIFFKFFSMLVSHGIGSEILDIIFISIFFFQIISLSAVNIKPNNDLILEIFKYIEIIVLPHKILTNSNNYIIISSIVWGICSVHIILSIFIFVFLSRKTIIKLLFFFLSIIDFVIYYYLIGPIIFLALNGTYCPNNIHDILNVECYSNSKHLAITILNFIFGLYSLYLIETFSLYYNQIGSLNNSNINSRVSCEYEIYSSNAKLIIYIIIYFYRKYCPDSTIFKYIYQVYIFLSCGFLSIYSIKSVFYYNKNINTLIHFSWLLSSWFSLCMILKICFNINDITLLVLFGIALIIIIFIYQKTYSYYNRLTKLDFFNEKSLVYIERFNSELIDLYNSDKKTDKILLNGVIKKFQDYVISNPELNEIFNKLMNNEIMKKKFFSMNQLSMLAVIFTIYCYHLEKTEIKTDITLHMCYFLINKLKNITFAIFLINKLKNNNHTQLYHKFVLMEKIKEYLINKLNKNSFKNSIKHIQIGSVILYNQYMNLFKIKIYDGTCDQIDYFDTLRNNVITGKITENFLKTGEEILNSRKEIFKIWEKIIELNPFSNESENDYMLYLKVILQDDILAKYEEKKFNLLKTNKVSEKNNIYHSLFKNNINSILLVDGYTTNGKILYATPNFPFLYQFNGKEIINTTIEELLPNAVLPFHKDLVENSLKYSNINYIYHNVLDTFLKGKNNSLYNIKLYVKPVPNLTYGLIFFILLTKIQDHPFVIIIDKDFKIDGFAEMNQGNSFTLNSNGNNNYYLPLQVLNHHIGIIIPEIMLQICYKDNTYFINKNHIDIKGNLYSGNNVKDLDLKISTLLDIIKKKGFLNIEEDSEEGRKALSEYNDLKRYIAGKQAKCFSIFFKVETRKFLDGKYRYHKLYITNDPLSLDQNILSDKTINVSDSDQMNDNKKIKEKLVRKKSIRNNIEEENNINESNIKSFGGGAKISNKNLNIKYYKYYSNKEEDNLDHVKRIKLKIPINKELKNENGLKEKEENNEVKSKNNEEEKKNENINNLYKNQINYSRIDTFENRPDIDLARFNKLKEEILNTKDSIQITFMKITSFLFVIVTIILVIYDYLFINKLYSNLVQYLNDNLYFTHSKIITSCIYISSLNIKWLKYKYIDDGSCLQTCSLFYLKILEKCLKSLKNEKDILYTFDSDFQEIVKKTRKIDIIVFNSNVSDVLYLDVNDYLNFIISKGVKLVGSFNDFINSYGSVKINMDNLIKHSYGYFQSDVEGLTGDVKLGRIKHRFKNNYSRIIVGIILCVILLGIFLYFIFDFNKLELFFLDKLINFSSPNFETYLKVLEDLKKKLKNSKMEEEENNIDEMEIDIGSKNEGDSKNNDTKDKADKKKVKNNDFKGIDKETKSINKKRGHKQNKIQQQRIKKKKVMSLYFYKENILFAIKTSIILICFISFFILSYLVYKLNLDNFLKFDNSITEIEELYYNSFRIFLSFKYELEKFQEDPNYKISILSGKDIQLPNFGNSLNDLTQNKIYSQENKDILTQLYNGDLCSLLFRGGSHDFNNCKEFLSSILLKGMEQAIIQISVIINNVIDELSLITNLDDFNNTVYGNGTNFKKYELFTQYYLLLSYLKNDEIIDKLRTDETKNVSKLTTNIIIIYFVVFLLLFILLCYFIFMYKYIYNSLFNFIAILSVKFISDDEKFYEKIIELDKKLYR